MRHLYSVFQRSSTLCFYNYRGEYPISGIFPNVHTLTLITCKDIHRIVQPTVFPNLKQIHYLSTPLVKPIRTIQPITWIFPSLEHAFYQSMMKDGVVDPHLITSYIDDIRCAEDGVMDMSLYIPEYGIMDGEQYAYYMRQFFTKNKMAPHHVDEYYHRMLTKMFMKVIHPGATPSHNCNM